MLPILIFKRTVYRRFFLSQNNEGFLYEKYTYCGCLHHQKTTLSLVCDDNTIFPRTTVVLAYMFFEKLLIKRNIQVTDQREKT